MSLINPLQPVPVGVTREWKKTGSGAGSPRTARDHLPLAGAGAQLPIGFDQWMKLDMQVYLDEWSLSLDLKILARTIPACVEGL